MYKEFFGLRANPFNVNPGGQTVGIWLASGGSRASPTTASAALVLLDNGAKFTSGIVFKSTTLASSTGTAIAMPLGYTIQWFTGAAAPGATIVGKVGPP